MNIIFTNLGEYDFSCMPNDIGIIFTGIIRPMIEGKYYNFYPKYEVVDRQLFVLSIIKYGIEFTELKC